MTWWLVPFLVFFVVAAPGGIGFEFQLGLKGGATALVLAVLTSALLRLISMGSSLWEIRQRRWRRAVEMEWTLPNSERIRPISIVMVVRGGREQVVETVDRLLALDYPNFEVVVINDGSPDGTLACLMEAFSLHPTSRIIQRSIPIQTEPALYASAKHPQLTVIAKPETGREDSLNCGLNISRYPLICALDTRVTLDADALIELARGFIENVTQTVAVSCLAEFYGDASTPSGSDIRLSSNGIAPAYAPPQRSVSIAADQRPLDDLQRVDRAALFHAQWLLRAGVGNLAMLPGVVSLLKKAEIVAAGGYRTGYATDTLDLLLTAYQVRKSEETRRVLFLPEIMARIEPFSSLDEAMQSRAVATQKSFGIIVRHLGLTFSGQGDWRARLALPVFIVTVLFAPIWEWMAVILVDVAALAGGFTFDELVALLMLFLAIGLADSLGGLLCDEVSNRRRRSTGDILNLSLAAITHAITFRWMMGLAQLRGMLAYISGRSIRETI
ncbi:glycosyltransferase [Chloracidobacterium aggregatum]|uniref:Glycosyltransferase n=2 Tax=Chloracidobacterium TaxID=458032 RepID=A0ABX8B333_9BACT|nr:glycosyltransferase [Chloracidobacterium aggregatum]QUV85722.1 glycosyltransferase [Chloracidobacterium sp. 2]QUV87874.1 glycosyltransferase [Chloracidobacterium sp. S]QUV93986.1 glycosyltransferase [Chloracidobacterium sp. N]QUV97179.1 glycosyltransferase [Chloracidobacterium sp. E]